MKIIILLFATLIVSCSPLKAEEKMLDIQEITSDGGIKAWLVEDQTLPIISIKFSFKGAGAIRDGQDKQGLARLLSNIMDEGAGDLTSQEFQKSLSDNSISLSFNSGRDNFSGQVKTLSRNKDKAFNLLKLALTKPRFDTEPVERMRLSNITRVKSSMGDPGWIAARIFNDVVFQGHPYALNSGGTLSSLPAITIDDLKAFKKNWLTKDRLMVGATGNINKKELAKILDQIFGDLPATGKQETIKDHKVQNSGKSFYFEQDIPQTMISMVIPSIKRDDPDYYALQVMNYIFGGGGFGSRLMTEIREKRGLTYGIYSGLLSQKHLKGFTISTSTKNESVKEMRTLISQEIKRIIATKVSDQELKDAKSYIVGSMPLSLTSTGKISGILLSLQLKDRPIDHIDTFPDKINAVTAVDIQRVAKRILKFDAFTTVMIGKPENIEGLITVKSLPNVQ